MMRSRTRSLVTSLAVAVLLGTPAARADADDWRPHQPWSFSCSTAVEKSGPSIYSPCEFQIILGGEIDEQQLLVFAKSLSYKHDAESAFKTKIHLTVSVDSLGGRVATAMKIGRMIRKESGTVSVGDKDKCLSSCVFILMGGIERQVFGKVGIHRLFLDIGANTSTAVPNGADVKAAIGRLVGDANAYADEMNVPRKIVDDMMAVPSDSIKMLNVDELFHLGVLPVDPYEMESREIAEAKQLGITRVEYLGRKRLVRQKCYPGRSDNPYLANLFDVFDDCYKNIMHPSP